MNGAPRLSPRQGHLCIAAVALIAEVLVATTFARVHFIRSYVSDFLAVMPLYHLAKAIRDLPPRRLAAATFGLACLVEVSQCIHLSQALGFPRGSLPSVLLGTDFSWIDLLMYFAGCLTSYGLDVRILSRLKPRPSCGAVRTLPGALIRPGEGSTKG